MADRLSQLQESSAKMTSTTVLYATDCFDCGAAAVHAMGVNGFRSAQAWIESHHVICKAKGKR